MIHTCSKFAVAAVAVMLAAGAVSAQTPITVTNLDDAGAGSLRDAITMANSSPAADTIEFSVTGTIDLESQLPRILEPVTIDGGGEITLDAGDGADGVFATGDGFRIFDVDDAPGGFIEVNLTGLTLTGGDTPTDGGGSQSPGGAIRNRETLTLTNVHVVANAAGGGGTNFPDGIDGGGIFNLAGFLTLIDCSVVGNKAGDGANAVGGGQDASGGEGGGISSTSPGELTLIRSTVSGNTTGMGGMNDGGRARGGRGGGIHSVSTVNIFNSTISGNQTVGTDADGGGISFIASGRRILTISNSTITDNFVSGEGSSGGGIYTNTAQDRPGDIFIIDNSIIAGNMASDDDLDIRLDTAELFLNNSLIGQSEINVAAPVAGQPSGVGNLIGVAPNLGPLADNGGLTLTHALLAGSPAIDAGDPSFDASVVDDVDQRGAARVTGLRVDIGAVESSPTDFVLGDANLDGVVNFSDIPAFIAALQAGSSLAQADINQDGVVDFTDIGPFIGLLAASSGS